MANQKIIKNAFINSAEAVIYVALVVVVIMNGERLFGNQENKIISGIAFLLTFVFSAAVMGVVIFGRPILWYLDGFKKEAVKLIIYTLGFLFVILVCILLVLIIL
jgi:hypothetical protein